MEKYQHQQPLEAVEQQLINAILLHPEYHALLSSPKKIQHQEFAIEENPFFHLSLHVAIFEQIKMDKPLGIRDIYLTAKTKLDDEHAVLHAMMACLSEMLAKATQSGNVPEDQEYLELLKIRLM